MPELSGNFLFAAFNKTMDRLHKYGKSLKEFNYNNKEIADDIYSAINSTQFLGISVSFKSCEREFCRRFEFV